MKIEEIIRNVEEKYSENNILELLDEEVLNWDYGYDEDDIDEFDSRWDFYLEYNNGEAENVICDEILKNIGTSRDDLCYLIDDNDINYLFLFEEWLSDYTGHNFNV